MPQVFHSASSFAETGGEKKKGNKPGSACCYICMLPEKMFLQLHWVALSLSHVFFLAIFCNDSRQCYLVKWKYAYLSC